MYSYKINNSYTVYVNTTYLNECIKASKAYKKNTNYKLPPTTEKNISPLPVNTLLKHKIFGFGKVISTKNGILNIAFKQRTIQFIYPDALQKGYLFIVTS